MSRARLEDDAEFIDELELAERVGKPRLMIIR